MERGCSYLLVDDFIGQGGTLANLIGYVESVGGHAVGATVLTKTGGEKVSGSASTALPGRKLVTSKKPRMLKPFEIELLRQDLKAVLARPRVARRR